MPIKRAHWPAGRVVRLSFESKILEGNPLGDPSRRELHVWLPPQYDDLSSTKRAERRYPVLFDLVGFTGSGMSHTNWSNFGENVPERAARLLHEGKIGPMLIVFPDCFTALGGNQYINSSAVGNYADYLTEELIPLIDATFRTLPHREHRGCFGKSSGGYGAIIHAMRYPRFWGAIADHSGDAYFDFVYRCDWPEALDHLARFAPSPRVAGRIDVAARDAKVREGVDDGRIRAFLDAFWAKKKVSRTDGHVLMMLCMAATYDPDPDAPNGFRVPFNMETGELIDARWKMWLRHDPIHLVKRYQSALKSLKGIWIDCGWADQYRIHFGNRILSKLLEENDIEHTYEEFDDTHSDIDYRLDRSLPFLYKALKP